MNLFQDNNSQEEGYNNDGEYYDGDGYSNGNHGNHYNDMYYPNMYGEQPFVQVNSTMYNVSIPHLTLISRDHNTHALRGVISRDHSSRVFSRVTAMYLLVHHRLCMGTLCHLLDPAVFLHHHRHHTKTCTDLTLEQNTPHLDTDRCLHIVIV